MIINVLFLVFVFVLKHSWYCHELNIEEAKNVYPRFYNILRNIGFNALSLFSILFFFVLCINLVLLFNIITLYRDRKIAVLFFTVTAIIFFLTEVVLRTVGFKPGMHIWSRHFRPVNNLSEYKGFYADENGITKVVGTTGNVIAQRIASGNPLYEKDEIGEVYGLAGSYLNLLGRQNKNTLSLLYFSIKQKPESTWTEWETAVVNYIHGPINEDGFRSISFRRHKHEKPSVLLLGDSFTWGHSASDITNSFADILLGKGYVVYNTGITGTDVAQYLAVARKYIPELLPDFVVVNFYLGNDVTYFKREILPHYPVFFYTNAGVLVTCPYGKYFENKEAAYHFLISQWHIPERENTFNDVCSQFVLTTLLWKALIWTESLPYINPLNINKYHREANNRKYPQPYCNTELKAIKRIAEDNGAKFILSSIPEVHRFSKKTAKDFSGLFEGLEYVEMEVEKSDYNLGDGHFNDKGHKNYAEFILNGINYEK